MPTGTVVLIHEDLPLSNNRGALHTYLSILHDAAAKLQGGHDRNLVVVFPVDAKGLVMEALTHE
jgi:hypothetical protein